MRPRTLFTAMLAVLASGAALLAPRLSPEPVATTPKALVLPGHLPTVAQPNLIPEIGQPVVPAAPADDPFWDDCPACGMG